MAERLRLRRHPDAPAVLARRAAVLAALRRWLDDRGLLEVDVPVLLPHAGQEPHLHPPAVELAGLPGPLWLQTSPELPLRTLVAAGAERVYALGPAFRGGVEELSPLHQPQFTLLEWYHPASDVAALVDDVRGLGAAAAGALGRPAPAEGLVLTVAEACARFAGVDLQPLLEGNAPAFAAAARAAGLTRCRDADDPLTLLGRVLVERIEPALAGQEGWVFLRAWPAAAAALARLDPDDPRVALRVEAYLGGLEVANGWVELTDPSELAARWEADAVQREGVAPPRDEGLLAELAAARGGGELVGMALGVDRLLLALLGGRALEEVLPLHLRREGDGREERPER